MKKEVLQGKYEKQKIRMGVMPTYVQRDRTKFSRKEKHRNNRFAENHSISF